MNDEKTLSRITDLELAMMHLQKDFESLNEMVLKNGRRLDEILLQFDRLSDRLDASLTPDDRDPESEKPPHY